MARKKQDGPTAKPKAHRPRNTEKSRDEIFAYEYIISGGNAARAAKKAGSTAKDLYVAGNEFLRKPKVLQIIADLRAKLMEELHVTAKEIIGSLLMTARATMADLLDDDGRIDLEKARITGVVNQIKKVEVETRELVDKEGNEIGQITKTKVELYSKLDANKQLAQMLGLQQSLKVNEYDAVCRAVKVYMAEQGCTLRQALDVLGDFSPLVSKYSAQILESGLV